MSKKDDVYMLLLYYFSLGASFLIVSVYEVSVKFFMDNMDAYIWIAFGTLFIPCGLCFVDFLLQGIIHEFSILKFIKAWLLFFPSFIGFFIAFFKISGAMIEGFILAIKFFYVIMLEMNE